MRKTIIAIFGIVGMLLGVYIGELATSVSWLKWLAIGGEFGFKNPIILDLSFLQLTFGIWFKLSICGIIFMVIFGFIGKAIARWLKV